MTLLTKISFKITKIKGTCSVQIIYIIWFSKQSLIGKELAWMMVPLYSSIISVTCSPPAMKRATAILTTYRPYTWGHRLARIWLRADNGLFLCFSQNDTISSFCTVNNWKQFNSQRSNRNWEHKIWDRKLLCMTYTIGTGTQLEHFYDWQWQTDFQFQMSHEYKHQ